MQNICFVSPDPILRTLGCDIWPSLFREGQGGAICATRDIIRATQVAEQSLMHVIMIEFSRSVCRCCGVSDVSKV